MPESDRFEMKFRAGWRAAYRDARSDDASDDEVSDRLVTHLCKTLRDQGGIPGFLELAKALTAQDRASISERFDAIDRIVKQFAGHRHTLVAAEAAKSTLILRDAGDGDSDRSSVVQQFAFQVCKGLTEHYFFANARINLVEQGSSPRKATHTSGNRGSKSCSVPGSSTLRKSSVRIPRQRGCAPQIGLCAASPLAVFCTRICCRQNLIVQPFSRRSERHEPSIQAHRAPASSGCSEFCLAGDISHLAALLHALASRPGGPSRCGTRDLRSGPKITQKLPRTEHGA